MKNLVMIFGLSVVPISVGADGFVMGAGRWTCGEVVRVSDAGTGVEKGQLVGWILGRWTAATLIREKAFVDTVEQVGGLKIANATVAQCRKAPEKVLYRVVESMIVNTK